MTSEQLQNLAAWIAERTIERLQGKSSEYSEAFDRLSHFKKSAKITNLHPLTVGCVLLDKHILSIFKEFTPVPSETYTYEFLQEKIIDAVCYLVLLYGLALEDLESRGNHSSCLPECKLS